MVSELDGRNPHEPISCQNRRPPSLGNRHREARCTNGLAASHDHQCHRICVQRTLCHQRPLAGCGQRAARSAAPCGFGSSYRALLGVLIRAPRARASIGGSRGQDRWRHSNWAHPWRRGRFDPFWRAICHLGRRLPAHGHRRIDCADSSILRSSGLGAYREDAQAEARGGLEGARIGRVHHARKYRAPHAAPASCLSLPAPIVLLPCPPPAC